MKIGYYMSDADGINVYTDGACSKNGYIGAVAGIGIYFGINDSRNVSEKIRGKQTNNVAELTAIIRVAEILKSEVKHNLKINIFTDSQYSIRACTTYGEALEKKNWKKKKSIPNIELVRQAYYLFKNTSVNFQYVKAHTNSSDIHSIGNHYADLLATNAISGETFNFQKSQTKLKKTYQNVQSNAQSNAQSNVLFLKVPYKEKEDAKKFGMRWNPTKKKWYIHTNADMSIINAICDRWEIIDS